MYQTLDLLNNANLSLAGYATLVSEATRSQIGALIDAGMSQIQAKEFAARYPTVVGPTYHDATSDFDINVFQDAQGNVTLAFRRSREAHDLIDTDGQIALDGAGFDQIISLYNWWQQVSAPAGQAVPQYALSTEPGPDGVLLFQSVGGIQDVLVTTSYCLVPVNAGFVSAAGAFLDVPADISNPPSGQGATDLSILGDTLSSYLLNGASNANVLAALQSLIPRDTTGNSLAAAFAQISEQGPNAILDGLRAAIFGGPVAPTTDETFTSNGIGFVDAIGTRGQNWTDQIVLNNGHVANDPIYTLRSGAQPC